MDPLSDRRPPYIPPKHLTADPFLTAEQLVSEYQEFSDSLRYVSTAPELVFERLVTSLRNIFNTALEPERKKHKITRTLLEYAELETRELEDKVAEEVQGEGPEGSDQGKGKGKGKGKAIPAGKAANTNHSISAVGHGEGRNPVVGNFRTQIILRWDMGRLEYSYPENTTIPLVGQYSSVPDLPITITSVPPNWPNKCEDLIITKDSIIIGTLLSSLQSIDIGINWLEIGTSDPDFQFGKIPQGATPTKCHRLSEEACVTFQRPYATIPVVVVWLSDFSPIDPGNLRASHIIRFGIETYVTDITRTGFKIRFLTTIENICPASFTWVACSGDRPDVFRGSFSTTDVRPWNVGPRARDDWYTNFHGRDFASPPRVIMGFDSLDLETRNYMYAKFSTDVSDITEAGMSWYISSGQSTNLYSATVSYLAIG